MAAPAPPKLEPIEDAGDSAITVTTQPGAERSITQKRELGRVSEVKVTEGGSTYYLRPNTPAGTSVPGDATGSANRGPMWQIFEFGGSKPKSQEEDAASAPPPPPLP